MPKNFWDKVIIWFGGVLGVIVLVVVINGALGWWDDRYNKGPVISLSATATPRPPLKLLGVTYEPTPLPTAKPPFTLSVEDMCLLAEDDVERQRFIGFSDSSIRREIGDELWIQCGF